MQVAYLLAPVSLKKITKTLLLSYVVSIWPHKPSQASVILVTPGAVNPGASLSETTPSTYTPCKYTYVHMPADTHSLPTHA